VSVPVEHRVTTADLVEIALYRVPGAVGTPVLLVPGTFSTRLFWLGARAQGFAYYLAEAGFDPWVLELRGHGGSQRPHSWTMDDWARFDAPAAVEVVASETGRSRIVWIGHSAGGVVGAALAGSGHPATGLLGGLVLLGSPGPGHLHGRRRIGAWLTFLAAGAIPRAPWHGHWLGLGPEAEPGRLVADWMRWNISGRWRGADGRDYLAGLAKARIPVLAVAGGHDRTLAPPAAVRDLLDRFGSSDRTLIVAGREHGFAADYDHPGLVIGRAARQEIWPRVVDWLRIQDSGFGIRDSGNSNRSR
jgi:predicted alpha/beta hydrolase